MPKKKTLTEAPLEIIWLHNPLGFPYVREIKYSVPRANSKPPLDIKDTIVVGYETPERMEGFPRGSYYQGRMWIFNSHDPYEPGPSEAVVVESIAAGKASFLLSACTSKLRQERVQ